MSHYDQMQKRYLIVDQNVLRKDLLRDRLFSYKHERYVIPDLAFLEMTKTPQWEQTLRDSLAILSKVKARIFVSRSVGDALQAELTSKVPINGMMLHKEATKFVREILQSVSDGSDGYGIGRIKSDPENHQLNLAKDHLNHKENKFQFGNIIDTYRAMLPEDLVKRLRSGKVSQDERLNIIFNAATVYLPQHLADYGFTREKSAVFIKQKPMLLRYMYLNAWQCIDWLEMGGYDSL